ncbi:MAG TPA: ribulose-phosphate 3-epimerase [Candidatus Acidoferrales bacterium]
MSPSSDWIERLPANRLIAEFSLWSAKLSSLAGEIERVDRFVDIYHIDVADGHFSPALLFFPDLVAAVRKLTSKPLHVHLMVTDDILAAQIEQFAEAGSDCISVHVENSGVDDALAQIQRLGVTAGLVMQLHTPVAAVAPYLDRIRFVTLLGTQIGVKGKGLDEQAESRLREARLLLSQRAATAQRILLAADGGIREHTVPLLRKAGAETIVMGSLAFGAENLEARMAWVHAQSRKT